MKSAVVMATLTLALAACTAIRDTVQTIQPTPPPPIAVGVTLARGNWQYTATKVERVAEFRWSSFGNVEKSKGVWVIVSLTLRNLGTRNFGIGEIDFELLDSASTHYDACISFACSSLLSLNGLSQLGSMEQFPPGVDVHTALTFDVSPLATGLKLVLKQADGAVINLESALPVQAPTTVVAVPPPGATAQSVVPRVSDVAAVQTPKNPAPTGTAAPWDLLRDVASGGNTAEAVAFASTLGATRLHVSPSPTLLIKVYVQATPGSETVYVVIPRSAVSGGVAYSPYGRWASYETFVRQTFFLDLVRVAVQHYPNTVIHLFAYRDDGAPLGEATNTPNLSAGAVLPGF